MGTHGHPLKLSPAVELGYQDPGARTSLASRESSASQPGLPAEAMMCFWASCLWGYYAHLLPAYPATAAPLSPPQARMIQIAASPGEPRAQARPPQTQIPGESALSFGIYDGHLEEGSDALAPSFAVAIWENGRSRLAAVEATSGGCSSRWAGHIVPRGIDLRGIRVPATVRHYSVHFRGMASHRLSCSMASVAEAGPRRRG